MPEPGTTSRRTVLAAVPVAALAATPAATGAKGGKKPLAFALV